MIKNIVIIIRKKIYKIPIVLYLSFDLFGPYNFVIFNFYTVCFSLKCDNFDPYLKNSIPNDNSEIVVDKNEIKIKVRK